MKLSGGFMDTLKVLKDIGINETEGRKWSFIEAEKGKYIF